MALPATVAAADPSAVALIEGDQRLTYDAWLIESPVPLAIQASGCAAAMLNPRSPQPELKANSSGTAEPDGGGKRGAKPEPGQHGRVPGPWTLGPRISGANSSNLPTGGPKVRRQAPPPDQAGDGVDLAAGASA